MFRDYVHLELGREIEAISGTYTPLKESMLNLSGKDILYVVGMAVVDTACCGSGSFLYAIVPGHIVTWKGRIDESGLSVSSSLKCFSSIQACRAIAAAPTVMPTV